MLMSKLRSYQLLLACLVAVGFFMPATVSAEVPAGDPVEMVAVKKAVTDVSSVSFRDNSARTFVLINAKGELKFTKPQFNGDLYTFSVYPARLVSGYKVADVVKGSAVEKVSCSNGNLIVGKESMSAVNVTVRVRKGASSPEVYVGGNGVEFAVNKPVAVRSTSVAPAKSVAKAEKKVTPVAKVTKPEAKKVVTKAVQPKVVAVSKPAAKVAPKKVARKRVVKPYVKTVSLEMVDADLVYVIKYLAKEMGRNVYVAPDVTGSVTVTLHKVRPEGALALILKMQPTDLEYKIVDNTVIVADPEKLASIGDNILTPKTKSSSIRKNLMEKMYRLEVAPAAGVVEFLKGSYPDVVFTAHPSTNGFFAKGTKSELLEIQNRLGDLDQAPVAPPAPTREYIPVKYGEIADVQNLVKTLVPNVQLSTDTRLGLLIVDGTDAEIEQVQEVLARLDKPVDQVMLDVKVVDLSESGSKNLGVTWSDLSGSNGTFASTFAEIVPSLFYPKGSIAESQGGIKPGEVDDEGTLTAGQLGGFNFGSFGRTPFMIRASLQFVISNGDGKILASPRVATQSGEEASIHIGDKYPIVFYDPRAGQFQVNYVDIGTKIKVKPEVKSDGYIVCTIEPTVSSLVELINNQYPRTAERTVKTKMRVKDGDTVVLGGLVRDEERHSVSRIPLLGDLPLLGVLFRQIADTTSRTEVILMMTPHIMK